MIYGESSQLVQHNQPLKTKNKKIKRGNEFQLLNVLINVEALDHHQHDD